LSRKTVILGLGNILLKDEGIGVHVIKELEKKGLPQTLEIIDAGTSGLEIIPSIKDTDTLIIIDAIKTDKAPGTVYRLKPEDLPLDPNIKSLSLHQIGVLESLSIVKNLGKLPREVIIIGIEPKEISLGLELSQELKQKIPDIVNIILKEIHSLEKLGV